LSAALEVTVVELLDDGERSRRGAVAELLKDPFVAQFCPSWGDCPNWSCAQFS
jgi:hypothetical protein